MRAKGIRKGRVLAAVLTALLLSIISRSTLGSEPIVDIRTLNLDVHLNLPDTIIINAPFTITFDVIVNDTVHHYDNPTDKISLSLPQYCEVVEGNAVWRGVLSKGSHVTLQVIAKFTHPQRDFFEAYVSTCSVPSHPEIYTTRNVVRSRYFSIVGPPTNPLRVDARGNRFVVCDTVATHAPLPVGQNQTDVSTQPSAKAKYNRITINVSRNSPTALDRQTYFRSRTNIISFETADSASGVKKRVLPKTWSFDCGNCGLEINPDSTANIVIDELKDSATLQIEVGGLLYKVQFRIRSVTEVSGYFRYVDNFSDTVPGYGTWAELYGLEGGQLRRSGSERCSETIRLYTAGLNTSGEPNLNLHGVRNPTSHVSSEYQMSGFSSRVLVLIIDIYK